MAKWRLSSPGSLLMAAVGAIGGIYLLDLCVFEPYARNQKALELREEGLRVEGAAAWALRTEQDRLLGICRALADREELSAAAGPDAFVEGAAGLSEVDAAWRTGADGQVLAAWWRDGRGPPPREIRRSLVGPPPAGEEAGDSGLLSVGGEVVVFARSPTAKGATGRLYLARRLTGGLLASAGCAIPAELILVAGAELPKGLLSGDPTRPAVWTLTDGRLAAAWPARDAWGRPLGYFRAHFAVPQIVAHASRTRRTILIILSLSAVAVLLVVLGASVFLANPVGRLLRQLQRVESGECSIGEVTRGLRGEPLLLAERLQSALTAMSELSKTDELTGLPNRRQFDEALRRAFYQARRHAHPVSVMVMDIDLFKAVNDMMGHRAGDEVIKVVAGVIKKCCRQSDLPARPGGDEFAVLLPETPATAAAIVAERIRKTVHERSVLIGESRVNVSLSIGIADLDAGRTEKPEDLVALADEALYAAKQLGRNRFVQAHEIDQEDWVLGGEEGDRVEMLRSKLAGLDTQFKSLFVRALQEIVQVIERRDPNMADRARKVQHYSTLISRQLNLSEDLVKQIELAALVHDIGMVALPDSVALCSGPLTEEQMEIMRRHTIVGAQVLEGTEFLEQAIPVARFHHERWDGTGYPDGLSGLSIPPICRIVAVADAFDAMTSRRRFREKMPIERAFEELHKGAGTQFDPDMVSAFIVAARKLGEKLTEIPLPRAADEEFEEPREPRGAPAGAEEPAPEAVPSVP